MQITIKDKTFDILDIIDKTDRTFIYVDTESNVDELADAIQGKIDITVNDGDNLVTVASGTYKGTYIVQTATQRYLEAFKKAEPTPDTVAQLNEQITNLELTLCELYESKGV